MSSLIIEILGYIASGFVIFSLLMTKILRLRILNLVGSLFFIAYGILLRSIPIILTNLSITIVNVVQLSKLLRKKPGETSTSIASEDSSADTHDPR